MKNAFNIVSCGRERMIFFFTDQYICHKLIGNYWYGNECAESQNIISACNGVERKEAADNSLDAEGDVGGLRYHLFCSNTARAIGRVLFILSFSFSSFIP